MKKTALALILFASAAAHAAGPFDGIYNCALSGATVQQAYITVNGQPDGRSIFAVAAIAPTQPFFGYGIGQVTGAAFSGQTMLGAPFSMTADALGMSGTIDVQVNGAFVHIAASCARIF
jgi:hypothetical protein